MADATRLTSTARSVSSVLTGLLAVLTCPCHLPFLLLLLSGTAAGGFVSDHTWLVVAAFVLVFILSIFASWRLSDVTGRTAK
jgi:mercuric ion transport protein